MDCLVTGGLGFIGRALTAALIARGHRVRVLDNGVRGIRTLLPEGAELMMGDVRDPSGVERAMAGVEAVFHLAAINGTANFYERPREVFEVGVLGTHAVLDAALRHRVGRFLFMSTSEVYQAPPVLPTPETVPLVVPDPRNPRYSYGGGKIAGELMTCIYGRDGFDKAVIVRPHNVYGPNMGYGHVIPELAWRILEARCDQPEGPLDVPLQGNGDCTRAFVYVDDFVEGCLLAFERGEHLGTYHVGAEDEIAIRELAGRIAETLGEKARFWASSAPAGQTLRRCPDISRLRALGYAPRVGLKEGLDRALESVRRDFASRSDRRAVGMGREAR